MMVIDQAKEVSNKATKFVDSVNVLDGSFKLNFKNEQQKKFNKKISFVDDLAVEQDLI